MRTRNIFDPASKEPFKLSRSKLELFLKCPRCFYLDRRLGIGRIDGPPFNLNIAVDALMKREFDAYRLRGEPHPVMIQNSIEAIPFAHAKIEEWRDNRTGVQVPYNGFLVFGAVDDVWVDRQGNLIVVDYKATGTDKPITLDDDWKVSYKRQMEVYQWLLRGNGFPVSDTGYFVYVNARKDRDVFDRSLHFDMHLLPYAGSDIWVSEALTAAQECLMNDNPPQYAEDCEWCRYRREAKTVE